jgi:hypothetical protein
MAWRVIGQGMPPIHSTGMANRLLGVFFLKLTISAHGCQQSYARQGVGHQVPLGEVRPLTEGLLAKDPRGERCGLGAELSAVRG